MVVVLFHLFFYNFKDYEDSFEVDFFYFYFFLYLLKPFGSSFFQLFPKRLVTLNHKEVICSFQSFPDSDLCFLRGLRAALKHGCTAAPR